MSPIDKIVVSNRTPAKEALGLLNSSDQLILLVVDKANSIERTVTDGDIRRFILEKGSLDWTVGNLPSKQPILVTKEATREEVSLLMYNHSVNHIPVVDEFNRPIGLHLREEVNNRILLSEPHMSGDEQEYVSQAFRSNWIAPLGPNVDAFEQELSEYVGGSYVAALSSGTAAIHLALRLLDVASGDIVLCQSFTFIASAAPITYQGARPAFVDSDLGTWNMSPLALEKALKYYDSVGISPKAIIVTHLYGQSANMERIMLLSEEYQVPVIEDSAESIGSKYNGTHTGTFGDFGIFSFNGNKIITTSGGGALVSNNKAMIDKAKFLSTQAKDDKPYYEHTEIGYNYRMSNVLAGIGRAQLNVLDNRVESRRKVFENYQRGLREIDAIEWMPEYEGSYSNRWLSVFILNPDKTNITSRGVVDQLSKLGVEARHVWKPMHLQPVFEDCEYFTEDGYSYCDYLFENGVCLPSSSSMTSAQQRVIIDGILSIFSSSEPST